MSSLTNPESLLSPVSAADPAGPNLEYDPDFLALFADISAIETTQPPRQAEWREIVSRSIALSERTKDLRIAVALTRALVITEGWQGLASGLSFLRGLLDKYWISVHPRLEAEDDNDPTWRINVLADLGNADGILADLVTAPLVGRGTTAVRLADLESAYEDDTGEQGVDLFPFLEIRQKMQSAGEDAVHATLEAVLAAVDHLAAIETLLARHTQQPVDQYRGRLADMIGRARHQLENSIERGDLVVTMMAPSLEVGTELKFESMEDFSPEEIADAVPALKELLETRRKLRKLLLELPGTADEAADVVPATPPSPTPRTGRDEPARTVYENAQFTVYRPSAVVASHWHTLLAFAHLAEKRAEAPPDEPDPIEEVRRQAMSLLGEEIDDYQRLTDDSMEAIPADSLLTFVPRVSGVEFNPLSRSFRWTESVHCESFRMRARAELAGHRARGRLSVYLGSILIGDVNLSFRVDAASGSAAEREPAEPAHARPYRKIFPSYAHTDTAIVEQFERFAKSLGDSYLRDVTTLRAGEVWDERIGELIAGADVFQLFWSTHSMASPYVRSEWERALALARPNFVRPVYWEDPLPGCDVLPPGLNRLHFQRIAWTTPAAHADSKAIAAPTAPTPAPWSSPQQRNPESQATSSILVETEPTNDWRPTAPAPQDNARPASKSHLPILFLVLLFVLLAVVFFLVT